MNGVGPVRRRGDAGVRRARRRRGVARSACALAILCSALALASAQAQAPYARFDAATEPQAEAAPGDAVAGAWQGWSQRSAAALVATGQPRELAFAALLRGLGEQDAPSPDEETPSRAVSPATSPATEVAAWRQAAADRAGDDVLAHALLAATGDAQTRVRAAQRWLGAEPQNLAPLLARGGSIDALLADARTASGFDLHMLDQLRWMQAALLRTPVTAAERTAFADGEDFVPDEHAAVTAAALWNAVALPDPEPLLRACAASATRDPARLRDCRHVAGVMANRSDTMVGRLIGLGLQAQLAASPAERAAAQFQERRLHWQNLEWGRASAALPRDGAGQFARLLADATIRTESELVERALQDAGVALDPPAGWQVPR